MIHRTGVAAVFALVLSSTASVRAAEASSTPAQRTAIRAANWLDVKTGVLQPNAVILIEGDRITEVGSELAIPTGVAVIDLGSATLLPGLIDAHSHLMARLPADVTNVEISRQLLMKSQADRALEGAANARATLHAGFTTVRDAGNEGSGYADVALRNAINSGLVEGPRMQVATRAIAAVGQYHPFRISTDLENFPTGAQMISGVEEARRAVREQIGHGADLIKIYADWSYPTLTIDEMKVIVEEAHKQRRKVAAHATTTDGIRNAVAAGVDSIEHCEKPDRETLEKMKKQGTFLVSTADAFLGPKDAAKTDRQRASYTRRFEVLKKTISLAREVGVKIASGMDAASVTTHGENAQELTLLVGMGVPAIEVIQTATTNAAELVGWADRVGTLAPKMFADIIAVEGNPLTDITTLERVKFVMKGGVVVVSASSHGGTTSKSTSAPE